MPANIITLNDTDPRTIRLYVALDTDVIARNYSNSGDHCDLGQKETFNCTFEFVIR